MSRPPDFLLIGAPKAGTSALHAALTRHPELFLPRHKEPKYYMCGDSPPPHYRGPGDAHSNREWVWQRARYLALFDDAPEGTLRGESTPFYLYNRDARRRIAADAPDAKLVAVLRDPVDRAYSNWMHLWMDGLEPVSDLVTACELEQQRIDAGWAPFWHYRSVGMYGRQVQDLFEHFPRQQVLLLRYRELVEDPGRTLDRVCGFLGVSAGAVEALPSDNSRPFVQAGLRTRTLGPVIRAGARAGAFLPPHMWRKVSRPLVSQLHRGGSSARPHLSPEERDALVAPHREDIALLELLTGESFAEWLSYREGSTYHSRRGAPASVPQQKGAPEARSTDADERVRAGSGW
jgi:hypothetical protein